MSILELFKGNNAPQGNYSNSLGQQFTNTPGFLDQYIGNSDGQGFTQVGSGVSNLTDYGALGLGAASDFMNYGLNKDKLKLAQDNFAFNKMDRNRTYSANKLKYNNALARTGSVNEHYGLAPVAKKM